MTSIRKTKKRLKREIPIYRRKAEEFEKLPIRIKIRTPQQDNPTVMLKIKLYELEELIKKGKREIMIQTPCEMVVESELPELHGKVVKVISPCYFKIDGQEQYTCIFTDGSGGGGMFSENQLKPIK